MCDCMDGWEGAIHVCVCACICACMCVMYMILVEYNIVFHCTVHSKLYFPMLWKM